MTTWRQHITPSEKYGLKLAGLKLACSATKELPELRKDYPGCSVLIWYDQDAGRIYTEQRDGPDWTTFHANQAIYVIRTSVPMTMEQIAEYVCAAVDRGEKRTHLFGGITI